MARVKRSVHGKKKRREVLEQAKGYRGLKNNTYRKAKEQMMKSLSYAYRDRRVRKRDFRRLWIIRINAGARSHGLSYNQFMFGLRKAEIELDRKVLADIAVSDPKAFGALAEAAKAALAQLDGPPAVEPITSQSNARLKHARKLQARRHRRILGQFLAEGEDIVEEALAAGILPVETLIAAERPPDEGLIARLARGGPVLAVRDALLAEVGGLGHPARVIALYDIASLPHAYPGSDPGYAPLGMYLDHVIDPGNVGTVVRACGALGPARLLLSPGCSDPLAGKGVRASMGAVFRVPIEIGATLPEGGLRVALVAGAATPLWDIDLTGPTLLAVGAERHGLPAEVVEACDVVCSIPQATGAESLNAAQAATLALYEAVRQRAGTADTRPSPA